jgi:hypothetical protein
MLDSRLGGEGGKPNIVSFVHTTGSRHVLGMDGMEKLKLIRR